MPNISPFCTKLETYLRMADVPHKRAAMRPGQMPKGKVPYVHMDGVYVGDSQLIIESLEKQLGEKALDHGMTARETALARIARRALEEAFYFVESYIRWKDADGYAATRAEFKTMVPGIALPFIRRGTLKKLHAQGTGRHTLDEVQAMGAADFAAIAELLGDQPFFLGERPRTIDCTVYAFAEGILGFPVESPLKSAVASHENVVAYRQRIRDRWWKDLS